jgi:hypothetical protein
LNLGPADYEQAGKWPVRAFGGEEA